MKGRPQRAFADETRYSILNAAKSVFLRKGFDGASISAIAKLAKVNRALIFHHFNDKETLWRKVKASIVTMNERPPQYNMNSAEAYFSDLLDYRFNVYEANPDLAKLIAWQQISQDAEMLVGHDFGSPQQWFSDIAELQQKKLIRKDIEAKLIALFVVYSSYGPFLQHAVRLNKKEKVQYKNIILKACLDQFAKEKG